MIDYLTKKLEKKDIVKLTAISVIIFYIIAHGFRLTSLMYSHDSLGIYRNEFKWQTSLGRFAQPVLYVLFGCVNVPWIMIGVSLICIMISTCLLVEIFEIDKPVWVIGLSGLMVCNIAVTLANATFISWVDSYGVALFLSIFGVWIFYKKYQSAENKKLINLVWTILALALCMGFYPAYINVSISIFLILIFNRLNKEDSFKDNLKYALLIIAVLAISSVVYYGLWRLILLITNIKPADTNNSVSGIASMGLTNIIANVKGTYEYVLNWILKPFVYNTGIDSANKGLKLLIKLAGIVVMLAPVCYVVITNFIKKKKYVNAVIQLIIIALFPFAVNFSGFLAQNVVHELMIYSFAFVYVFALVVIISANKKYLSYALAVIIALIIWNNIIYSNHIYADRRLQEEATMSYMTRLVGDIESVEGYEAATTEVVFVGSFYNVENLKNLKAFRYLEGAGINKSMMSYHGTESAYISNVMGDRVKVVNEFIDMNDYQDMPCYPNKGSIVWKDNKIYVKIAEAE